MRSLNSPRTVQQHPDGTTILKTNSVAGMRQMRCPKCHNMAAPTTNTQGTAVYMCAKCHTQFKLQRMGG